MAKGKSSKKSKDDNKKKKGSKSLKSLKADQQQAPVSTNKSLNSLKKIQKRLDSIITHREAENKKINQLKNNTSALSEQTTALSKQTSTLRKQLEKSEFQFSKYALSKDLLRIKTALEKKNSLFNKESNKLCKEITQLKDLTHRVEHKIQTLEKQPPPAAKQFNNLKKDNTLLFKKVGDFEEQLNQFSDTIILPDEAISKFSGRLKSLKQRLKQLNKNYQEQDNQIKLFKSDIKGQKDETEKHKNKLNKNFQQLSYTVSTIEQAQQQLLTPIETRLQELQENIQSVQQEYTRQQQIISGDTEALADLKSHQLEVESHQRDMESHQQEVESHQQDMESHQRDMESHQQEVESHQQEVESHQRDMETRQQKIESRQLDMESHQQGVKNLQLEFENHQLEINSKVAQFKDQLQQSQDELKQHIQLLREADRDADLEQSREFKNALKRLSEHLFDVTEQTNSLQSLFNSLQTQKNSENQQQVELSKQYLLQQQQLKKHNSQLLQLIPVISQTKKFSHQFEQIAKTQNSFLHQENNLKSNLQTLAQKTAKSHGNYQKTMDRLANHQQDQSASLMQLSEQIKKRSMLFGVGLLSALAVSALLFFNQQSFNQTIQHNESHNQAFFAQIKTDISNETDNKINMLNKQNSNSIKQQFNQIKESVSQASATIDVTELQSNWQEQHQLLQDGLSKTQTEQQALNQTVVQLSESIRVTNNQFQQLQKSMTLNSDVSRQDKVTDITITRIEKITSPFYTIQLLGAMQKESVMNFIKEHQLASSSRIFQTEFHDKAWYILVQGHYSSISQAKEKLQQLPDSLRENNPWIKKLP